MCHIERERLLGFRFYLLFMHTCTPIPAQMYTTPIPMRTCLCVCACVRVCVCVHACMHMCLHVSMHVGACLCALICISWNNFSSYLILGTTTTRNTYIQKQYNPSVLLTISDSQNFGSRDIGKPRKHYDNNCEQFFNHISIFKFSCTLNAQHTQALTTPSGTGCTQTSITEQPQSSFQCQLTESHLFSTSYLPPSSTSPGWSMCTW